MANLKRIEELEKEKEFLVDRAIEFERRMSKNLDLLSPATFKVPAHSWNNMPESDGLLTPVSITNRGFNNTSIKDLGRFDQKVQNNLKDLQRLQRDIVTLREQNEQLLRDNKNNQRKFAQLEEEIELNAREKRIIKDQSDQREKRFKEMLAEAEKRLANSANEYKKEIASLKALLTEKQQTTDLSKSSVRSVPQGTGPSAKEVQLAKKIEQMQVF